MSEGISIYTLWVAQLVFCIPLLILNLAGIISDEMFLVAFLFAIFISILTPTQKRKRG